MYNVTILGSTGSIGCSTLDVLRLNPHEYKVVALTANSQVDKLFTQCVEFKPDYAVLLDESAVATFKHKLELHGLNTVVLSKSEDLTKVATLPNVDIVMSGIVGSSGLLPTLASIKASKKVLLANKESLITSGKLMIDALLHNPKAQLIPVDSEHSAIFQCLPHDYICGYKAPVDKIILTASGGPFRTLSKDEITNVTPENAIKHPNWSMGKKISVDSSTLMNKGLELIEAHWLFGLPSNQIHIIIHPQSVIHSMVEFLDGSILSQLGTPDMKTPIAYALGYPKRIVSGSSRVDFLTSNNLTFEKPDLARFPCLQLAFDALTIGGAATAVLNAANEIAVEAFLKRQIDFYGINQIVEKSLNKLGNLDFTTIEEIIEIDNNTRQYAKTLIKS